MCTKKANCAVGSHCEIIAKRYGAICRAAVDGAVWISHLRRKNINKLPFYKRVLSGKHSPLDYKLPATMVLGEALNEVPDSPIDPLYMDTEKTFKEIWYEEVNQVGYHQQLPGGGCDCAG